MFIPAGAGLASATEVFTADEHTPRVKCLNTRGFGFGTVAHFRENCCQCAAPKHHLGWLTTLADPSDLFVKFSVSETTLPCFSGKLEDRG